MKCVKLLKQQKNLGVGSIIRTTDDDAREKVRGGLWEYAKKEEWKLLTKTPKNNAQDTKEIEPKVKKGKSKKELKLEKKRNS
jgi:hypothetical protein